VTAVSKFASGLNDVRSALDRSEQELLPHWTSRGATRAQSPAWPSERADPLRAVDDCMRPLRPLLRDVRRLFGPGPVGEQAELALETASNRLRAIDNARLSVLLNRRSSKTGNEGDMRSVLRQARGASESARRRISKQPRMRSRMSQLSCEAQVGSDLSYTLFFAALTSPSQ
jgi:hypothetical protein